jgi:general secretion pathway protein I
MNSGNREQGTGNPEPAAGVVGSSPCRVRRSPRPARARGFTLLEVLAALAVLAIAFAIGLGALGKSAQNAVRGAALDTAVERAQSVLAEQGLMAPLQDETLQGKFDDGMSWTLRIHALPRPATGNGQAVALQRQGVLLAQAGAIDIYQLDIAVQYGAGRVLRLSTQRAQAAAEPQP